MAEQFHHSGKADAGAKHFGGIGMSKLMRHNACEQADGMADLAPVIAQLTDESFFGTRPWSRLSLPDRSQLQPPHTSPDPVGN